MAFHIDAANHRHFATRKELLLAENVPELIRKRVCEQLDVFWVVAAMNDMEMDQILKHFGRKRSLVRRRVFTWRTSIAQRYRPQVVPQSSDTACFWKTTVSWRSTIIREHGDQIEML